MGLLHRLSLWSGVKKRTSVEPIGPSSEDTGADVSPHDSHVDSGEVPLKRLREVQRRSDEGAPAGDKVSEASTGLAASTPGPVQARSGPGSSSSSTSAQVGDALCFEAPPDEVYSGVSEAFSQMIGTSLRSSKWDKRLQAIKAISTVLRGLDLQGMAAPGSTGVLEKGLRPHDHARCWRLSCMLLNRCMHDRVTPVRLATLELFMETFANTQGLVHQKEVRYALDVLVEHIIDRLGDSNWRLHENARRCILFSAEHEGLLGLCPMLVKLRLRLAVCKGERAKVHFGILDSINYLLRHFPGRPGDGHDGDDRAGIAEAAENSWTQHDIAPFIIAGMDDALGPRVRNSSVALAVTVFQACGAEAAMAVLRTLRPAKQALLRKKFEETESSGVHDDEAHSHGDAHPECNPSKSDLAGLVICGSTAKPPAWHARPAPMPGVVGGDDDDESFMDGILEEAGMVFNGADIDTPKGRSAAACQASCGAGHGAGRWQVLDDEDRILEEELEHIGMDLDGLEEPQALFGAPGEAPGGSVEDLLSSLVGGDVDRDVSIEVF